jgi:multiple sugar transport system ATP-binding protein
VVNALEPKDRDIAMVFQNYALYPHMSVFQNMAYGLKIRGFTKDDIKARVDRAAGILELGPLLERKPRQLSGGQRQRVAMGRAIVREPAVFLFDEPLSNLDARLRAQTRTEISKLHQRLGTTFIYVTHDQLEAMTMATRLAVLREGVLQQVGEPQQLYDRPGNVFVAGFIGSPEMNFFNVRVAGSPEEMFLEGPFFRLPVPRDRVSGLVAHLGKEIIFGIRPEDLHDPEVLPDPAGAVIRARVEVTELLGNEVFLHLRVGDRPFLARVTPRTRASPGQDVAVALDMARMHTFDSRTEISLTGPVHRLPAGGI